MNFLSICDVFQNMTFADTQKLNINEQSLLFIYLQFWNWAVQIGTTVSVYPKQLERIKGYETETSKEVIKLVRSYVKSHNNSNAWAYYESTLEDLTRKHVKNLADLEKYNPKLAGKTRYDQQQLPLLAVVGKKKNNTSKKTYKPRYAYKKRVEQGVDWAKKKAHIYTDAENDEHTREILGLTPSQEWPEEFANLYAPAMVWLKISS